MSVDRTRKPPTEKPPSGSGKGLTEEKLAIFFECLREGLFPSQAARICGVGKSAISMRKARDPGFAEACEQAEAECERKCVRIISESKDWRAAMGLLERRFSSRWSLPLDRAKIEAHRAAMDAAAKSATPASAASTIEKWVAMRAQIPGRGIPAVAAPLVEPLASPVAAASHDGEEPAE